MSKDQQGSDPADEQDVTPDVPSATDAATDEPADAIDDTEEVDVEDVTVEVDDDEYEDDEVAIEDVVAAEDDASDDEADDEDQDDDRELVGAGVAAAGSARAAARRSTAVRSASTERKGRATAARDDDGERRSIFARIGRYLREVVAELRKVIWPGRKQMITYTLVVVLFVAFMVTLVWALDLGFAQAVLAIFG